jgi:hypothetical protein
MTTAPPKPLSAVSAHGLIVGPPQSLISAPAQAHAIAPAQNDYHHASHRDLLKKPRVEDQRRVKIDAIIVPTVRPPANLMDAAQLAIALDCPLITLHSGKWTSSAVAARRLPAKTDRIAIDMPDRTSLRLPEFATSTVLSGTKFDRPTDTSAKRNIGLMLCHMLGWKHVVFLDDDIEIPAPVDLELAAGLLDKHNIVGLFVAGFPDNSVVCHAYRLAGGPQKSFIGGGAIVVEAERTCSFFPDIYNDDWFYMLDDATGLQPVATIGKVKQRPYDPFRNPDRARAEELGDVLAEGVFWLLDQGRSVQDADLRHWRDFLARRRAFINHVLSRVEGTTDIESAEKRRMVEALKAARGRLTLITPDLCRDYLQALAADRRLWQSHMESLEVQPSRRAALRQLTRPGEPLLTCYLGSAKAW